MIEEGDLVYWKLNPRHIGLVLEKISGSFSRKSRVFWVLENTKIIQFDQDLEILYHQTGSNS